MKLLFLIAAGTIGDNCYKANTLALGQLWAIYVRYVGHKYKLSVENAALSNYREKKIPETNYFQLAK